MSTPTTTRPSTTVAIQKASLQGTDADPSDGCKDCVKAGLAILPVVPLALPNALRGANAEVSSLERLLDAKDLKANWYAMRVLPSGYLYVLKPDLTWDAYLVDAEGLLRMMPAAAVPAKPGDMKPMSEACKRKGDNLPAQVIAIDPKKHASVWLAFSRHRWTPKVLADYAANKDGRRDQRMTKLDVMAAAAGSLGSGSKAANAVKFGVSMTPTPGQYVADYTGAATRELINKQCVTSLRSRGDQGAALAKKMAEISKDTQGKTGAIILLRDDLGVTMDLNTLRNAETGRLGAYMAQNQQKRFIGEVIMGFEKAFTQNGQVAEWNKRFKPKYNFGQIATDRKAFDDKAKPWEQRINAMSDDVASLNGSDALRSCWRDFDPDDDQSAKDRQQATAACLHGAVKTKAEEALWDQWFAEDPKDPYAMLWGAATALDPDLGAFLVGKQLPDVGKADKFADVTKNLLDVGKRFRDHLVKRSAEDALALIGLAMASQVSRLKILNPALYRVAGMRVLMVASARTTITVTPVFMAMTQTQEALMLAEAAFGPPQASAKRLLDIEMNSSKRVFVVGSNGVDAYAASTTTTQKLRVVELWLPDELAKDMPALPAPATRAALPPPRVNPYRALVQFTKAAPGALAWVGLTLQTLNLSNSAKDLADSGVSDKSDAYFGIVSGVMGVSGVMAEIAAGTMERMAGRFAATTVARIALLGGGLASLSAVAESVQMFVKAVNAANAGDVDAAGRYAVSGAAFLVSGACGLAASLAVASGAGALTGVLGFLAPVGAAAASIPVAGWIAAGVIFLGIGLYYLWQAIKHTDTPLEVWLLSSVYGTGTKRFTPAEETAALNDVMYAMTIEVEWSEDALEWRNTEFYDDYDNFRFAISLPGAGANSVIDCKVTLVGKEGKKQVFHETIRPMMLGNTPVDPHIPTMSAASPQRRVAPPKFVWWEPPRISDRGRRYGGQLKLDDDLYSQAEVQIQYWPDQVSMPNFVLPKSIDQRTLAAGD